MGGQVLGRGLGGRLDIELRLPAGSLRNLVELELLNEGHQLVAEGADVVVVSGASAANHLASVPTVGFALVSPHELAELSDQIDGFAVLPLTPRELHVRLTQLTLRRRHEAMLQQTNLALIQARDAARTASRSKSEFLANMSHELRTPLNAIIGYTELLIEEESFIEDNPRAEDLSRIQSAGKHLLEMINEVLDLSRIEAGRMTPYVESVPIAHVLQSVATQAATLMHRQNNTFMCAISSEMGTVQTDRRMVKRILMNLLSNAAKFTHQGTVTLTATLEFRDNTHELRLEVQDTGIGIDSALLPRLFLPFVQADGSTTRRYSGTGLGLTLCQRLCSLLRGTITVDSTPGRGSTFTVRLPVGVDHAASPGLATRRSGARQVLLVHAEDEVSASLHRTLETMGLQVAVARTAERGFELAARFDVDLMVLDDGLGAGNAWSLLNRLKTSADTAHLPVLMLTEPGQEELAELLGAHQTVAKPVHPPRFIKTVRRTLYQPQRPFTVLLVEDDEATRELVRRTLENTGFLVREAKDGAAGLSRLKEPGTDLVLLDLMMPGMDGFELLDRIQSEEALRELPVLVATAKPLTAEERARLEDRAQAIIEKNELSRAELLQEIGDHVDSWAHT